MTSNLKTFRIVQFQNHFFFLISESHNLKGAKLEFLHGGGKCEGV